MHSRRDSLYPRWFPSAATWNRLYTPRRLFLLVSVSPSGRTNLFPLDQVTEQLYNVRELDHYASESGVVFLIQAASENKPLRQTYTKSDGTEGEFLRNSADHSSTAKADWFR